MRRLKISARACAMFVAIILIAGLAGLWLNERIENAERGEPGFLAGLAKHL